MTCTFNVRTERERNAECGLPATWKYSHGPLFYCEAHGQQASHFVKLEQIGGPAILNQRVKRAKPRYYRYGK